jgi:hypothetical protein
MCVHRIWTTNGVNKANDDIMNKTLPFLAAAILFPLMPQLYSFDAPRLAGLPFFYWYQLLWVPISAILTGTAYWLVTKEDRRRRAEARPGGPPRAGTASADAGLGGDRP